MIRNRILLSVALVMGLQCIFNLWYRIGLTSESITRQKELAFEKLKLVPRIWIFGDSHPMMGVNPALLPKSFNFAGTSENYFLNYVRLKHLLSQSQKPEILVLPAELHSLSEQGKSLLLGHELDDVYWSDRISLSFLNEETTEPSFIRWWFSARFFPYAGQFYQIVSQWKKSGYTSDSLGFIPSEKSFGSLTEKERKTSAENRFQSHFRSYPAIDTFQIQFLRRTMKLCKSEGIRLVFVQFPVTAEYRKFCLENAAVLKVDSILRKELKSYPVLSLRDSFAGSPELFSDPDHVNTKGAYQVTKRIVHFMESLRRIPVLKQ
jgi:hypothetical protein